jgi:hypothetical protein
MVNPLYILWERPWQMANAHPNSTLTSDFPALDKIFLLKTKNFIYKCNYSKIDKNE